MSYTLTIKLEHDQTGDAGEMALRQIPSLQKILDGAKAGAVNGLVLVLVKKFDELMPPSDETEEF